VARREPRPPQRHQDGRLPLSATPSETVDRLADGPRVRRWPVVALVVVLVLVAAGGWAEGRRRAPAERSALEGCAQSAVGAASTAERRVAAITAYVVPALGTRDRGLDQSLRELIGREAGRGLVPVDAALADCRAVRIWWFNESHDEALDAYVAFLLAQRDRLDDLRRDGQASARGYTEVRRLGEQAAARLAAIDAG
jgi:hypothetical protein